jgi:hypothetical protein
MFIDRTTLLATAGASGTAQSFSFQAPLGPSPVSVALSVLDLTSNTTRNATKSVCTSDTTPRVITFVRPIAGALVKGDDVILEVRMSDAVDKNIDSYEVDLGTHVVSSLDPRTGQSS